jgi:hypothetical protein
VSLDNDIVAHGSIILCFQPDGGGSFVLFLYGMARAA